MPRKKQIVGTKRKVVTVTTDALATPSKALLEIGSGSTEMFAPVRHPCSTCGQEKEMSPYDRVAESHNNLWGDGLCNACRARKLERTDPTGPLTGDQFDALWNQLSPRGKEKVRDYADRLGLTNRGVLNRFPQFRTG